MLTNTAIETTGTEESFQVNVKGGDGGQIDSVTVTLGSGPFEDGSVHQVIVSMTSNVDGTEWQGEAKLLHDGEVDLLANGKALAADTTVSAQVKKVSPGCTPFIKVQGATRPGKLTFKLRGSQKVTC